MVSVRPRPRCVADLRSPVGYQLRGSHVSRVTWSVDRGGSSGSGALGGWAVGAKHGNIGTVVAGTTADAATRVHGY